MAWFNRRNIEFSEKELEWITDNANRNDKSKTTTNFFNEDRRPLFYTIEISNLPSEADEGTLRRMLSTRMNKKDKDFGVEMTEVGTPSPLKIKRQLSCKLSFGSEAELISAINFLKKRNEDDSDDFFTFDQNAIITKTPS